MSRRADIYVPAVALLVTAILLLLLAAPRPGESEIDHLAQILELTPDSAVADVGAGSGEVSVVLAGRVPRGVVYSTEIDPRLLDQIRTNARRAKVPNIITIRGKADDTELPANCCDAIFLREVYHHLTDPIDMDRSLYRALRPGGRLAIIDFEPVLGWPAPPGIPANRPWHGVSQRIVAQELSAMGFQLVETVNWPISRVIQHYCLLFRKPHGVGDASACLPKLLESWPG
jgi:ubiquinone/menaquinone biosynthesis C-methylase UbiE